MKIYLVGGALRDKFLNIPISDRNSVADDVYSIAILFLKLKACPPVSNI